MKSYSDLGGNGESNKRNEMVEKLIKSSKVQILLIKTQVGLVKGVEND